VELAPRLLTIELPSVVPVLESVDELVPITTMLCPAEFVVNAIMVVKEPVPTTVEKPGVSVIAWVPRVTAGGPCTGSGED